MDHPADFQLLEADGQLTAELTGDWTSRTLGGAPDRLRTELAARKPAVVDLTHVGRCDTSGAYAVVRAAGDAKVPLQARPETQRLLELVSKARGKEAPPPLEEPLWNRFLVRIGRGQVNLLLEGYETLAFNGRILAALARVIASPRRFRWAPFVSLAERAGLDALPIVAVTSFFIGAVVGLLGAHMLAQFGAQVFAVELVGIAVLREFAIIITAVLLAGRSASSFAAEIGSMKMQQEIDAMRVMGVDPFEALVLPRFLALLFTIPLLTFIAALAGLVGGMIVLWAVLDISPDFFFQRIVDQVGAIHFWIGLAKSPVMAIVIAGIGCRQGMEVAGDVESLGRRVTAAVVHAIFSIIVIDAIFALIFMEANI
ncbi:MAG TPA: MlaE family lipid ABC transporter permease subunit [Caulobacteraceae bacterium]|jgi:phospholipid/cholesterol/gamma-HCH transport system permease protein